MSAHIIKLEESPEGGDMQALVKGLTAYNAEQANGETPNYLVATVKDDDGKLVGGLLGATYLGWLQIQVVWLDDSVRGQGYGSELMAIAEREGLRGKVQCIYFDPPAIPRA